MSAEVEVEVDMLNNEQREAVNAPHAHALVLAGAGTGKTRVLASRVDFLLSRRLGTVLSVAFTVKAARELRSRLSTSSSVLSVGTFHAIAYRLLRLKLPYFHVLDVSEQLQLVKRELKRLNLNEDPLKAQFYVNSHKEEGLRPFPIEGDPLSLLYEAYECTCARTRSFDFAELLLRSYELLKADEDFLVDFQKRSQNVLVDEFQDINKLQFDLLTLLAPTAKLFVVGDDDQLIYSWRGASPENTRRFIELYAPNVYRLEQNYRSTPAILSSANKLILSNWNRLEKRLWSNHFFPGQPVRCVVLEDEKAEVGFVLEQIQRYRGKLSDFAVLYRVAAQSRVFEECFNHAKVPYRVFGGLCFYERAEVKDVLAYLRLVVERHDDVAFERVLNTPKRGLGERTLETILSVANRHSFSLWQASEFIVLNNLLPPSYVRSLSGFLGLVDFLDSCLCSHPLSQQLKLIWEYSRLFSAYDEDSLDRRVENIEELSRAAVDVLDVHDFLAQAALDSGDSSSDDCVQLMTIHMSKGLEFDTVFLVGVEEALLPHKLSKREGLLEEERRLCYVAVTRAKRQLTLTYVQKRYGRRVYKSRFISELFV